MGGYGSGRSGRPTVESAFQIDIDILIRHGYIRPGVRGGCLMQFSGYHDLDVNCETHVADPSNSWIRLQYGITDYWTDEPLEIDEKIYLATSRPPFGRLRWCRENRAGGKAEEKQSSSGGFCQFSVRKPSLKSRFP
jgi:hypothetical protein